MGSPDINAQMLFRGGGSIDNAQTAVKVSIYPSQ